MIASTLFIKELWTLYPSSTLEYKMFPYSETMITKQTYIWFMCYYAIQLIVVHTWYYKFPEYRLIFGVWFILQVMEFIEFLFSYNEALLWFYIDTHKINLNVINLKYLTIISLTTHHLIWKQ